VFAARRRRALARLEAAHHEVLIRGPEGEQKSWDEKGKLQRAGRSRTEFIGYQHYLDALKEEAGLLDRRIEKVIEEIRRNDAFWGGMPSLVPTLSAS
jgi:hypothetical protein